MDKLISQLTLATPDDTDVIPFVDISDTTMAPSGTTKKATKADLKGAKGDTGLTGATGDQGIQGIQGVQGIAGISFIWKGAYSSGTTYSVNDAVSYNGSSYMCKLESTGNLPTNATYWDLMAQKGTDGIGTVTSIVAGTNISVDNTDPANPIINNTQDISSKANLASPAFTGTPTAPTQSANDNSTKLATTAYADLKLPLAGGTMTGDITLGENTSIALDPAGSADGKYSGITIAGTAGATIAFGDLVYLASSGKWLLTDADASATGGPIMIGMCVFGANDTQATKILLQGQIRADSKFPTLTVGSVAYLGETAGAIQTAIPTGADNVIRVVGFALTADEIYFNPSQDHQITVA